jgi:hypothetical protein
VPPEPACGVSRTHLPELRTQLYPCSQSKTELVQKHLVASSQLAGWLKPLGHSISLHTVSSRVTDGAQRFDWQMPVVTCPSQLSLLTQPDLRNAVHCSFALQQYALGSVSLQHTPLRASHLLWHCDDALHTSPSRSFGLHLPGRPGVASQKAVGLHSFDERHSVAHVGGAVPTPQLTST